MNYSIFKAPYYSFFSREFFRKTAFEGKGSGILYLFLIVMLSTVVSTASACIRFCKVVESAEFEGFVRQFPDMAVRNGRLSINKPSPYRINLDGGEDEKKNRAIVFDTTGKTRTTEDAGILVTAEGILVEGQKEALPWSRLSNDFDFKSSDIKNILKSCAIAFFIIGVILVPVFWSGHVLQALIYAALGLLMDQKACGYRTAVRLSSVCLTPAIVLSTLFDVVGWKPPLWGLLTVPVCLGYLFFAYQSVNTAES